MDTQLKPCVVYIAYESLLVELSRLQYLDIENLLAKLLAKAHRRFAVQKALVLGDWSYCPNQAQLEKLGLLCQFCTGSGDLLQQALQDTLREHLANNPETEAYLVIGGQSLNYNAIIRICLQGQKDCLLWTLTPPSPSDQELCTEWETIPLPKATEGPGWSRPVLLQAIALAADHCFLAGETPLLLSQLRSQLASLPPFQQRIDTWLAIAIGEQILVPRLATGGVNRIEIALNRQHALVQKALLSRERVLLTLNALEANREWIAFSQLEKALRSTISLGEQKSSRHAWLELLVAQEVLVAERRPHPNGATVTTTLRLNRAHPAVAAFPQLQQHSLVRLIVMMSNFMARKQTTWMAVSRLLKSLTAATTRIEARSALHMAEKQGIIQLKPVSAARHTAFPIAAVGLVSQHVLVQETLALRDRLIHIINETQEQRQTGIGAVILIHKCRTHLQMREDEAFFWLQLLLKENILYTQRMSLGDQEIIPILYLNQQDALVDQLLAPTDAKKREVLQ